MMHTQIASLYQLAVERTGAYGTIHGREAGVVTEVRFNNTAAVVSFLFKTPVSPESEADIRTALKPFKIVPELIQNNTVVRLPILSVFWTKKAQQQVDSALAVAVQTFDRLGLSPYDSCALCDQEGFDRVRLVRGIAMKTHDACHTKLMVNVQAAYRQIDTSTEHLLKGYIWAICGALLGALVNFFVNFYLEYQVVLLYALIPLFSMFMYKAAKAPLRKEIPFVLSGLSVVVSAGIIVLLYALYAASWGVTLDVFLNVGVEDVPAVMPYFLQDLGIATLFSLLGVSIVWRYLFTPRR
ncbi:MAG TPA: hypothetical protein DCR44_08060 [Acholeplasmatales bacterium]|nr:hypothetical protein [Acholeplasmatales bacterium]